MANDELNQLIKVAREAAFFIRSIDGYENSKIANELSSLAEKVESQKLLAIGRLAARVVYRNAKKAVEHSVQPTCGSESCWRFIKKLQQELGDDAEVELRLVNDELEILVTWREVSLHTRRRYSESALFKIHARDSEEAELEDFVRWSKSEHQAKTLQNKPADHVQYKQGDTRK